jgi:hypothetical protein
MPTSVATQSGTLSATHRYRLDNGAGKGSSFLVNVRVSDDAGSTGTAATSVLVSRNSGPHK